MPTLAEIEPIANRVRTDVTKARMAQEPGLGSMLTFGLSRTENDSNALSNLRQQEAKSLEWATRGIDAAKVGASPGTGGWSGWRAQGQALADGAAAQLESAAWVLPAIKETIADVPKKAAADVKRAAVVTGDVLGAAASGVAGGFLKRAWWVVGLVAIGAVGYLYMQSKVIRG